MEQTNTIVNIENITNLKESQIKHIIKNDIVQINIPLQSQINDNNNNLSLFTSVYNYIKQFIGSKENINYEYTSNHV